MTTIKACAAVVVYSHTGTAHPFTTAPTGIVSVVVVLVVLYLVLVLGTKIQQNTPFFPKYSVN